MRIQKIRKCFLQKSANIFEFFCKEFFNLLSLPNRDDFDARTCAGLFYLRCAMTDTIVQAAKSVTDTVQAAETAVTADVAHAQAKIESHLTMWARLEQALVGFDHAIMQDVQPIIDAAKAIL